jgi:hypothetical protein
MMASTLWPMCQADQVCYAMFLESYLFPMLARPQCVVWPFCWWPCSSMFKTSSLSCFLQLYCMLLLFNPVCAPVGWHVSVGRVVLVSDD